jgi:hypothetical protein
VKKLDEGATMVCYLCHKEGHKVEGGDKKKEKNKRSKLFNAYTNKVNKKTTTPFLLKK